MMLQKALGPGSGVLYLLLTFFLPLEKKKYIWNHHKTPPNVTKCWQKLTSVTQIQFRKDGTALTLRGQILSSWSSSQCPPQPHLFSSFLCSSSLSSSLWFFSSFLLLHPGPGERSCWQVFHDRSCAPTSRHLGRVNREMEDDNGHSRWNTLLLF